MERKSRVRYFDHQVRSDPAKSMKFMHGSVPEVNPKDNNLGFTAAARVDQGLTSFQDQDQRDVQPERFVFFAHEPRLPD